MDNIIDLLVNKCAELFGQAAERYGGDDKYGIFPAGAVISYYEGGEDISDYVKKKPVKAWRISEGVISDASAETKAAQEPKSGMFFAEGAFYISFDTDSRKAYLSFYFGPRYGAGYSYDIGTDEKGEAVLINEKMLWVS